MADQILFHLDAVGDWALGTDELQWIVLRARKSWTQRGWRPVAFIATNKSVLARVLRENGVEPSREAVGILGALPERFRDWRDGRKICEAA